MAIDRDALTPQQRLAISRRALMRQLNGDGGREDDPGEHDAYGGLGNAPAALAAHAPDAHDASASSPSGQAGGFGLASAGWPLARTLVQRWWRRHPANAAAQLAHPLLKNYAKAHPAKLVAGAAAVGALAVLVRPWRLLSLGAVMAVVMKSSDVAEMVSSLMPKTGGARARDDRAD